MRIRLLFLSLVGVLALSCSDGAQLVDPSETDASFAIVDAERGDKAGFYWLPPMVNQPSYAGDFDPALLPKVVICELEGDTCADDPGLPPITFTMEGAGPETVRLNAEDEH